MRGNFKINRSIEHEHVQGERVGWLDRFAEEYASKSEEPKPTAVDMARRRSQNSVVDQINSIMRNNKSTHATVDAVVRDMQDRVGLTEYLKRLSFKNNEVKKTASYPKVIQDLPKEKRDKIIDFIEYLLKKNHGLMPLPTMQYELNSFFGRDVDEADLNSEDMLSFMDKMIKEYQRANPFSGKDTNEQLSNNVNDTDDAEDAKANDRFFAGLEPNSTK